MSPLDVQILGPLTVSCDGREAAPSTPKPRQVLALLAARCGQPVHVDVLIEELWVNAPPNRAQTVLQNCVMLLRRSLAAALERSTDEVARDVLPFDGWGYRLAAEPDSCDAGRFMHLAGQGRTALLAGDSTEAALVLRRALRLWRGPALADVTAGPCLRGHRAWLEEARIGVLEQRVEADLRLGRHHDLIAELPGVLARHPLHENLYSLFLISLFRAGQPAQALDAFEYLRRNLRDELGIDPSPRVSRLHQEILQAPHPVRVS